MSIIHGHIRVKGTNQGVPGLVVSVRAGSAAGKSPKQEKTRFDPFERYTRSLGSTVTGASGEFRLEFGSKGGEAPKTDVQPDILLAVLSPATLKADGEVAAPSPAERLLYWTELPNVAPDSTEALEVRLLEQQLEKLEITLPDRSAKLTPEQSAELVIRSYQDSETFKSSLSKGLAAMRRARVVRGVEISKSARNLAKSFHTIRREERAKLHFGLSRDDIAEAKDTAMNEGLAKMEAEVNDQRVSVVTVYLDDTELKGLGVDLATVVEGSPFPPLPDYRLCQLLNERFGGTGLSRVRGLLEAQKEAADAAARLQGTTTTVAEEEVGSAETPEGEAESDLSLATQRRVLGQLKDMPVATPSAEGTLSQPLGRDELTAALPTEQLGAEPYGVQRLTPEELNAMLPAVQLGAGPTDVTAFHDFYNLQIAFPHVWTEAFDRDFQDDLAQLLTDVHVLHEDYMGENSPFDLPEELYEREDLEETIAEIRNFAKLTDEPLPEDVGAQFIHITSEEWNKLTPNQRTQIIKLKFPTFAL